MLFNSFQGDERQKFLINEYKQYRNIGKDFTQRMIEKFTEEENLLVVGKLMGIVQGKTFVFDSEEEANCVMDFSLYEYKVKGKSILQRYKEEKPDLNDKEAKLLEAQLDAYTSLFKIIETEPLLGSITLADLFNDDQEMKVLNINLSRTARAGLLIFTRIIPLPDFNMSSGIYFAFPENSQRSLLKRYKIMRKKVKSNSESAQRFIAFFKLNRKEGLEGKTADI